jgi:hypothetical protein
MLAAMSQAQRHFCLRVDATGWKCVRPFVRSNLAETVVDLAPPSAIDAPLYELQRTPTRVRLIRDVTPSGSIRVLMTSLLDSQRYPAADFGALYHQRWRIEEAFKRIKHRLDRLDYARIPARLRRQDRGRQPACPAGGCGRAGERVLRAKRHACRRRRARRDQRFARQRHP